MKVRRIQVFDMKAGLNDRKTSDKWKRRKIFSFFCKKK